MKWASLYSFSRQGQTEIQVFGDISIWDGLGTLFQAAEVKNSFPVRSLLKPFQFIATGLAQEQSKTLLHLAALGSISATEKQVDLLRKALESHSQGEGSQKTCLESYPLDEGHRASLKAQGSVPLEIYHTCFSKHVVIQEACRKWGWSEQDYLKQDHPYHKRLIKLLENSLKREEGSFQFVTDGCGLPTPVLSLEEMARLFQVLAEGKGMPEFKWIRDLMMKNPEWIGGPTRLDTSLMKTNPGKLIAKEGADGLLGVGVLPTKKFPHGLGIVIKLAAGYDPQKSLLATKPILDSLDLKCNAPHFSGQEIHYHYIPWQFPQRKIWDISPLVSSDLAVWPGDTPFSQKFSLHVKKGNHLTLSQLNTTVHVGSHTDAPVHFGKEGLGIESVDLRRYFGACQVISIKKVPHTEIVPRDIEGIDIVAPRVLFKTGSFPDPNTFNKDFNSLSAALIKTLSEKGIQLVGIDTPSIDLFESQELPAHHATLETQMAILEGISLEGISPGIYQLVALPLKIKNADASPVRAVLIDLDYPCESELATIPGKISF